VAERLLMVSPAVKARRSAFPNGFASPKLRTTPVESTTQYPKRVGVGSRSTASTPAPMSGSL
jgi:hypothetical protein